MKPQYTVGKNRVPLHALCGEWTEVLRPDGSVLTVIVGDRNKAAVVCMLLNGDKEPK